MQLLRMIQMVHPSYQLNPGDMFQVEVEKVLYSTGEQKQGKSNAPLEQSVKSQQKLENDAIVKLRSKKASGKEAKEATEGEEGEAAAEELSAEDEMFLKIGRLRRLRRSAREILQGDLRNLSAKQKKELRLFRDTAQRFLSKPDNAKMGTQDLLNELQVQIDSLYASVPAFKQEANPEGEEAEKAKEELTAQEQKEKDEKLEKRRKFKERVLEKGLEGLKDEKDKIWAHRIMSTTELSKDEVRRLAIILKNDAENPVDESKPYATPWRPRPFMSAFAFIPRYLEVNPNICAAVYLRHPVARKGVSEVPTPFSYLTSQLAHNWYLGRG